MVAGRVGFVDWNRDRWMPGLHFTCVIKDDSVKRSKLAPNPRCNIRQPVCAAAAALVIDSRVSARVTAAAKLIKEVFNYYARKSQQRAKYCQRTRISPPRRSVFVSTSENPALFVLALTFARTCLLFGSLHRRQGTTKTPRIPISPTKA